jgi:hypothetical protein
VVPSGTLAALAGARLPAMPGPSGALGPAAQRCFGRDGQVVDCAAPGGRVGVRDCTTQRWGRAELRPLTGRPSFADDPGLQPGAVLQGARFARGEVVPVGVAPAAVPAVDRPAVDRTVTVHQAHTAEQLLFDLGADDRAAPWLTATLGLPAAAPDSTVVLAVTDTFRAADVPPGDPAALFRDGAAFADPDRTMTRENPPLVVASVVYGRQLLVAARGPAPAADLTAALQAAAAGKPAAAEIRAGVDAGSVLAQAELRVAARGGTAGDVQGYEALRALLAARPPASERGAVVAYTLRYLADGAPVELAFATAFDQTTCTALPDRPYAVVLTAANVDKDIYVWLADDGEGELVFHADEPKGGSVDLTQVLARRRAPEGVVQIKLGNGDCFRASGDLSITVDGVPRWTARVDKLLSDCGWQLEAKVKVSSATGEVDEVLRWIK